MPLLKLHLSDLLPANTREALLKELSSTVAKIIGKPENYVMVTADQNVMLMGGTTGPTALVEVRSIGGLSPEINKALSKAICALLRSQAQIPSERVFLNFQVMEATHWGWRGDTFA